MSTRKDPDAAYAAFMKMPAAEWLGLILSLASGGVLTPAEQEGFERASKARASAPCPKEDRYSHRSHGYAARAHQCPYRAEINGDTSTCTCCEACESECRDDI